MKNIAWPIITILVLIVILGGIGFATFQADRNTGGFVPGVGGGPPQEELISQIARDPNRYIGQKDGQQLLRWNYNS